MLVVATSGTGFVFEVKNDSLMKRTRLRPLPSGRMSVPHAVTFASTVGVAGTALLTCEANALAAGLAASNLILYSFIYTPLKQIHPVNTWVGAIVGAIPPLLGWVAASGQVSMNAMILPAALYFWQLPHFMALAYLCRKDYADGGFKMFSLFNPSGRRTALVALRNCLYLLPLGYLAYDLGITSWWFCLESTLLALAISCTAASFYLNRTTKSARTMFHASLLYLPVFMSGLLFHRVADNDQCLTIEDSHMFKELSSSKENTMLQRKSDRCLTVEDSRMFNEMSSSNENPMLQKKATRKSTGNQVCPPVAYASIPPFPFLPAPSYP
ncbi:acyltransferase [Lithospermum erythrorhizon]|uniref:Heme O synthase n=1 Tax=Lithospermum erythrorhizon TaxID=34254 RepID=A0AAV3RHS7_LITER